MKPSHFFPKQQGSILLEGLIGILIFSLGILALIGLQAVSVKNTAESKRRSDAAYLADSLIAQMWVDNLAALPTNYVSPGGPRYTAWLNGILSPPGSPTPGPLLPGISTAPAKNLPTVALVVDPTTQAVTATVTVFWQSPGESAPHQYVSVAQIGK